MVAATLFAIKIFINYFKNVILSKLQNYLILLFITILLFGTNGGATAAAGEWNISYHNYDFL